MKIKNASKAAGYFLVFTALFIAAGYFTLPVNRINMCSRLVILGDFNSDNKWDLQDAAFLSALAADQFSAPVEASISRRRTRCGWLWRAR